MHHREGYSHHQQDLQSLPQGRQPLPQVRVVQMTYALGPGYGEGTPKHNDLSHDS